MTGPTQPPFDKPGDYPPPGQGYPPPGQGYPPPGQGYPPPGQGYGQAPPPSGYAGQGYQGYGAAPATRNGFGVAALLLGIFSVLLFFSFGFGVLLGVLGVVFGVLGRGRVRRGEADNRGVTTTGIVLSAIGIVLGVAFFFFLGWAINYFGFGDLASCIDRAGGDQAAIERCQTEYTDSIQDRFGISITPAPAPTR